MQETLTHGWRVKGRFGRKGSLDSLMLKLLLMLTFMLRQVTSQIYMVSDNPPRFIHRLFEVLKAESTAVAQGLSARNL